MPNGILEPKEIMALVEGIKRTTAFETTEHWLRRGLEVTGADTASPRRAVQQPQNKLQQVRIENRDLHR